MPRAFTQVVLTGLAVAVLALSLALTACGQGGATGGASSSPGAVAASASPGPPTTGDGDLVTFTSKRYGFSFRYPSQFTKGKPGKESQVGTGPVFDVIFADMGGAMKDGAYLDSIDISVYRLGRKVSQSEIPQLTSELQSMLAKSTGSLKGIKVEQPLAKLEVNGARGFGTRYSFQDGDQPLTVAAYFLFKGRYEYQVTTQAASEHWAALKDKMTAAAQSLIIR